MSFSAEQFGSIRHLLKKYINLLGSLSSKICLILYAVGVVLQSLYSFQLVLH
jgi:hypothetical protein